jgi:predicted nuclease of restriction endonuclease-like (RecB) superfamily
MTTTLDKSYLEFINDLKDQIKTSRVKAHLAVNRELVLLYSSIGQGILQKLEKEKWGSKVIENISQDLRSEFPEMSGLSTRNLKYMRQFAELNKNLIGQQAVAQLNNLPFFNIPWGHNVVLMDQVLSNEQRLWYAEQIIKNG